VAHVQGARGVGGNVLDERFPAAAYFRAAEVGAFRFDLLHDPAPEGLGERHVAEAGTGHFDAFHAVDVLFEPLGQIGRYVARRPVQGLREEHGQVRGHVAVLRIPGGLHDRFGRPFKAILLKEAAEG